MSPDEFLPPSLRDSAYASLLERPEPSHRERSANVTGPPTSTPSRALELPAQSLTLPPEIRVPNSTSVPAPVAISVPKLPVTPTRLPTYKPASRSQAALRMQSQPTLGSMPHAIKIMPESQDSLAVDTQTERPPAKLPAATVPARQRPPRLGQSIARVKRPTRLGGSIRGSLEITRPTAPIQTNPLVGRPVVELAERIPDADSDVIRQPR